MADVMPKADPRTMVPHPEDFAAWCDHPVTRFVATAMQAAAEQQREVWFAKSWGQGDCDPQTLTELRTRADAYMAFLETGLKHYAALLEA